jgi:hypothetical protein
MEHIKSYENYLSEAKEGKGPEMEVEKIKIPKGGPMKEFEIGGKKYKGVLSTFSAIGAKQKAMGEEQVGVITLPGEKEVYELFAEEGGSENKEEKK